MASVLMMSDEQKLAYEQQQAYAAGRLYLRRSLAEPTPLPPAPEVEVPTINLLLRPSSRPPPFAPPSGDDNDRRTFNRLAPPPPPDQPPPVVVEERVDAPVRLRLGQVAVELGDNLFRRRRFHEAQRSI